MHEMQRGTVVDVVAVVASSAGGALQVDLLRCCCDSKVGTSSDVDCSVLSSRKLICFHFFFFFTLAVALSKCLVLNVGVCVDAAAVGLFVVVVAVFVVVVAVSAVVVVAVKL